MINFIYCYTNKINNKKYVGQTNNLQRRLREHKSCSFNPNSMNYNCVIHRAIRKYGLENFDIEVLETLINKTQNDVNEAEEKWIREKESLVSQHGYNVLEKSQGHWKSFLTPEVVSEIKMMIKNKASYDSIVEKYAISKSFISCINAGKCFFDKETSYPLCAYRISSDTYDSLIEDLIKPEFTFKELSKIYSLSESTIKKFNYGMLKPNYYQGSYPIRKITPRDYKAQLVIDKLTNTSLTKKEICELLSCSDETVRRINLGLSHKDNNLKYPLR